MSTLKNVFSCHSLRKYATTAKIKIVPDENIINDINNNIYKPRHHPGVQKPKNISIPDKFAKAIMHVTEDYPLKAIVEDSKILCRHLKGRVPPMESEELKETTKKTKERVLLMYKNFVVSSEEDEMKLKQAIENKTATILREKIYNWKPINYNVYNSLVYLLGRSAAEYSVLTKIFTEMCSRDPEFKPNSLFDFGSGVGTVTWAANSFWKSSIYEYFNVDASRDMNDLAQVLLQGGRGTSQLSLKGIFYRQFLPANNKSYDLVVSAYSLLELPTFQSRLQTMLNLWNKTGKYLVIVEQGTNAGFKVINEIRDFILQIKDEANQGHVFSPCPHDDVCPRFMLDDGTPCNFEVSYTPLPVYERTSELSKELYTYVVLKKGKRSEADPLWPRIVRPTLVRSKHTICRMCLSNGELKEVIFTASKHGKTVYHCARASKWGDLLPITVQPEENQSGYQY